MGPGIHAPILVRDEGDLAEFLAMPSERLLALLLLILAQCALAADDAKDSPPPVSLSKGIIQFTPPPEPYVLSYLSPDGEQARYTLPGLGCIQIWAIPGGAPKTKQAEELAKPALFDMLKGSRAKSKEKEKDLEITKPLAFEPDDRFFCTLREQFSKGGNTFDQTHIYRNLLPHQLLVSAIALADPPENGESVRKTAQTIAAGAALVPKGQKAPPAPTLGGNPLAEQKPDRSDIAAAQKELESATAKVESELLNDPKYKSVKAKADAAEARLKNLRNQQPPDRAAIAAASEEWLDAKRPLESMRQAALAKDPAVIEARKKLADARKK
jgi:hypothetical protein